MEEKQKVDFESMSFGELKNYCKHNADAAAFFELGNRYHPSRYLSKMQYEYLPKRTDLLLQALTWMKKADMLGHPEAAKKLWEFKKEYVRLEKVGTKETVEESQKKGKVTSSKRYRTRRLNCKTWLYRKYVKTYLKRSAVIGITVLSIIVLSFCFLLSQ